MQGVSDGTDVTRGPLSLSHTLSLTHTLSVYLSLYIFVFIALSLFLSSSVSLPLSPSLTLICVRLTLGVGRCVGQDTDARVRWTRLEVLLVVNASKNSGASVEAASDTVQSVLGTVKNVLKTVVDATNSRTTIWCTHHVSRACRGGPFRN